MADPPNVQGFYEQLESSGIPVERSYESEGRALDLGYQICNAYASTLNNDRVGAMFFNLGYSAHDAASWSVAAVRNLCPQYINLQGRHDEIQPSPAPATPPGPCSFSPATPECPPQGLTPEQRENW